MSALLIRLPSNGVGRVVLGHRVAADVDVAAVAGLRVVRFCAGIYAAQPGEDRRSRQAVQDVVHRHAADRRADRVVAERGDDDRHALLAGRLVARDAEDPDLGVGTRIDQRAGRRVDAVFDADDEPGTGVLRAPGSGRAEVVARLAAPASLRCSIVEHLDDDRLARAWNRLAVGQESPGQCAPGPSARSPGWESVRTRSCWEPVHRCRPGR